MHESSEEFKIRRDPTTDCGVSCPLASEKIPSDLLWEKRCCHFFLSCIFDRILFILADNDHIHKSLNESKSWLDLTEDYSSLQLTVNKIDVVTFLGCYLSD